MPRSRAYALLTAALLAAGCSPLTTFNALVPKDRGGARVASGIAYGSGPRLKLDVYAPRRGSTPAPVVVFFYGGSWSSGARVASGVAYGPGSRRKLDVYAPRRGATPAPVVVFFYGGSWSSGTRGGYAFVGRALAARGVVTVVPDYRLVPDVRYPGFVEDGAAAVRWAARNAARYGGDPARIVVAGHSAGAYIAAMLAVDDRWLGADRRAVKGFVGLAGPYDFAPFDVEASRAAFGRWPRPAETQPVTWAGAGDPPSLLLVGSADRTVMPRNSAALAERLRAGGVPVVMKSYPGLGHVGLLLALARPFRGKAPVLDDMARFVTGVR